MMYLIFPTEQAAMDRSEQIAQSQGCYGDVTKYWFAWVVSYTDAPETALMVPDDETDKLTPAEITELKNQAYMEMIGWFPPLNPPGQ